MLSLLQLAALDFLARDARLRAAPPRLPPRPAAAPRPPRGAVPARGAVGLFAPLPPARRAVGAIDAETLRVAGTGAIPGWGALG